MQDNKQIEIPSTLEKVQSLKEPLFYDDQLSSLQRVLQTLKTYINGLQESEEKNKQIQLYQRTLLLVNDFVNKTGTWFEKQLMKQKIVLLDIMEYGIQPVVDRFNYEIEEKFRFVINTTEHELLEWVHETSVFGEHYQTFWDLMFVRNVVKNGFPDYVCTPWQNTMMRIWKPIPKEKLTRKIIAVNIGNFISFEWTEADENALCSSWSQASARLMRDYVTLDKQKKEFDCEISDIVTRVIPMRVSEVIHINWRIAGGHPVTHYIYENGKITVKEKRMKY